MRSAHSFVRACHSTPCSLQSQLNCIIEVLAENGLWSARIAQLRIHIANRTDLKVLSERLKRCVEDTSSTDKPTAKRTKYMRNTYTPKQHAQISKYAEENAARYFRAQRVNQSRLRNRAVSYVVQ